MSLCVRKITLPPSSRIPTSKLTRVRVDGLLKSKAQVCPPRSGSDALPRFALNWIDASSKAVNCSAVWDLIERKCFIRCEDQPGNRYSARTDFIQGLSE